MCKKTEYIKENGTYIIETHYKNGVISFYTLVVSPNSYLTPFTERTIMFEPQDFNKIEPKICEIEKRLKILQILDNYTVSDGYIPDDFLEDITDDIINKFDL